MAVNKNVPQGGGFANNALMTFVLVASRNQVKIYKNKWNCNLTTLARNRIAIDKPKEILVVDIYIVENA